MGGLGILLDDRPYLDLDRPSAHGRLVGYLVVTGGSVSRSTIAEQVWGEDTEETRRQLRNALVELRCPEGQPDFLIRNRSALGINREACRVDVRDLDAAIEELDAAVRRMSSESGTGLPQTINSLKAAAESVARLYRGPLLGSRYSDDWVDAERRRLHTGAVRALCATADALEDADWMPEALDAARNAFRIDPADDLAAELVIRLEGLEGDQAAVERHYHIHVARRKDRGLGPPAEGVRLVLHDSLPKTLKRPHNVFEDQLVRYEPGLVGRSGLMRRLQSTLCSAVDPRHPCLVEVVGPPGVGKTRLVLHACARVAGRFGDRAWFVPLEAADGPSGTWERIAGAMLCGSGGSGRRSVTPEEVVISTLSRGASLLVLDTFENLLPQGRELIQALRSRGPEARIVVTSQRRLRLPGQVSIQVGSLGTRRSREGTHDPPAVALFRIRYRAHQSGERYYPAPDERESIRQVCERLSGIPLAVELAAAAGRGLHPAEILERLEHMFRFLRVEETQRSKRHITLEAAIRWSVDRLRDPAERRFFSQLATFRGGWSVKDAQHITRSVRAYELLRVLEDASLLFQAPASLSEGQSRRFGMLDVIRDYAWQLLPADQQLRVGRRHAQHYARLAVKWDNMLSTEEVEDALRHLDTEHENILAALNWSTAHAPRWALALSNVMEQYWSIRGLYQEGRRCIDRALRAAKDPTPKRAAVLRVAGHLARQQGDYAAAINYLQRSLRVARHHRFREQEANALGAMGLVLYWMGQSRDAKDQLDESLAIARELGDRTVEKAAIFNLALVACEIGDLEEARARVEESMRLQKRGSALDASEGLWLLGKVSQSYPDELPKAREYLLGALEYARSLGDGSMIIGILHDLSELERQVGNLDEAYRYANESLAMAREVGERRAEYVSLNALALLEMDTEQFTLALEHVGACQKILRELGNTVDLARTWLTRARLARIQGDHVEQDRSCRESLRLQWAASLWPPRPSTFWGLIEASLELEDYLRAARLVGVVDCLIAHLPESSRLMAEMNESIQDWVGRCRSALGDDAFEQAFNWARNHTATEIVAFGIGPAG